MRLFLRQAGQESSSAAARAERRAAAHAWQAQLARGRRAVGRLYRSNAGGRMAVWAFCADAPEMPVSESDIVEAHRIMVDRVLAVAARDPRERPPEPRDCQQEDRTQDTPTAENDVAVAAGQRKPSQRPDSDLPRGMRRVEARCDDEDEEHPRRHGIDASHGGRSGAPGSRRRRHPLARHSCCAGQAAFAHLFVDEAQDLSPHGLWVRSDGRASRAAVERVPKPRVLVGP